MALDFLRLNIISFQRKQKKNVLFELPDFILHW